MVCQFVLPDVLYRTSCLSIIGLIFLVLGVLIYAAADYLYDWLGTLLTILSMLLMVWEGVLKRHLLTNPKEPIVLSLQAMVFVNNAVGFVAAMVLVLSCALIATDDHGMPHGLPLMATLMA